MTWSSEPESADLAPPDPEPPVRPPNPLPPHVDRGAALAQGAPGIPANFVFWVLGVVLGLSLGGLVGEHLFSSAGLNPARRPRRAAPPRAAGRDGTRTGARPIGQRAARVVHGPVARPTPHQAPAFSLPDQAGRRSPSRPPPRVVVLTFFDASCNDICPVLGVRARAG